MPEFMSAPETWVAVSFFAFVAILIYYKVPKMITDSLDERSAMIAKELEEATKLREDAQALLASYQRQQREAEKESENIVEQARQEAELMREEAEAALAAQIDRRTRLAEERIGQAEAQAVKEVKDIAADIAAEAARKIIAETMDDTSGDKLIEKSIAEVKDKMH